MKLKTFSFLSILFVAFAGEACAQATVASHIQFQQCAATLAEAASDGYKVYNDGSSSGIAAPTVTCGTSTEQVTCLPQTTPFQCSYQIPIYTPGSHSLSLTATNAAGESLKSTPFTFTYITIPQAPQNIKLVDFFKRIHHDSLKKRFG